MKIAWTKNVKVKRRPAVASAKTGLPFGVDNDEADAEERGEANTNCPGTKPPDSAESLQYQGNKLAEEGKYHEALSKWEAALSLMPDNAIIHEQKAQVLLEVGDAWRALTAATRATELEPSWPEAWVTLARAQLNFGEPDKAIESFDKALAIKPDIVQVWGAPVEFSPKLDEGGLGSDQREDAGQKASKVAQPAFSHLVINARELRQSERLKNQNSGEEDMVQKAKRRAQIRNLDFDPSYLIEWILAECLGCSAKIRAKDDHVGGKSKVGLCGEANPRFSLVVA